MSAELAPGSTVIVVGGGVVGTSAAYALARSGYIVTLVTADHIGDGATSGNAGLVVPADSVVWPGPANARAVPATLLAHRGSGIEVCWRNFQTLPWGVRFLTRSTARRYAAACRATHALSRHSLGVMEAWAADGPLGTDLERTGMLFLVDSREAMVEARHARLPLTEAGERYEQLSQASLEELDGSYTSLPRQLHALYARGAARGDSRAFSQALARRLSAGGAEVLDGRPATRVLLRNDRVVGIKTGAGDLTADAVVLAAGVGTRRLARTAGVHAPILPVKGYAATVRCSVVEKAPRIGGVLECLHVAFSRMGDHLRLTGGAEIGRTDHSVEERAVQLLQRAGDQLFPGVLDWPSATYVAEHRPMTPTGLPLIGPTKVAGLYLDTGHGSLGWTQAAGSADLLVQLISGTTPALDPAAFLPNRPPRPTEPRLLRPVN